MSIDSPPRVLVVDDNPAMLETLSDILEVEGFEPDTAPDAEAAIEKFRTGRYPVALVDIMMPGMNGVEMIRRVRPGHPETRFIIITAYTDSILTLEAEQARVEAVLHKPVDPDELIRLVRESAGVAARVPAN